MNYFSSKYVAILALVCVSVLSHHAVGQVTRISIYINAKTGSDLNDGSITAPWASFTNIAKIKWPQYGAIIYLDCNSTWRQQLLLNPGTATANGVSVLGYGNCQNAKPTIMGSDKITLWKLYKGNIYYADFSKNVTQVYANNNFIRLARYPDDNSFLKLSESTDSSNDTSINCQATDEHLLNFGSAGRCTAIDKSLPNALPVNDLIGAIFNLQTASYWYDSKPVTNYNGQGIFTLASKTRYQPLINNLYYLENKLWMLEKGTTGGWYYDASSQRLYLRMPDGSNPLGKAVEASVRDYGIYSSNFFYSTYISGINIKNTSMQGILVESTPRVAIVSSNIERSGSDGVVIYNARDSVDVLSASISDTVHDAIKVVQSRYATVNITQNTINNSGIVSANAGSPKYALAAILTQYPEPTATTTGYIPGVTIKENTVNNSGYIGIRGDIGSNISSNIVSNTCLVLSDCGSIYTWNYSRLAAPNSAPETKIQNNIVENNSNSVTDAYGIYLDDFTNKATVSDNTIIGGQYGMLVHLAFNNNITNNVFYSNTLSQLYISENLGNGLENENTVHDNTVTNNIFFGTSNYENVKLSGNYRNILFGTFDKNIYFGLYPNPIVSTHSDMNATLNKTYSFSEWQQNGLGTGMDKNGRLFSQIKIADTLVISEKPGDLILNNNFNSSAVNWSSWNTTLVYEPLCANQSACITGVNKNPSTGLISSNIFALTKDKSYRLNFDALTKKTSRVIVRRNGPSNYDSAGLDMNIDTQNQWQHFSTVFIATSTLDNGIFNIEIPTLSEVSVDNVSLVEVNAITNKRDDDSMIIANKNISLYRDFNCPFTSTVLAQQCNEYVDTSGNTVYWPIQLAPMTSKIIIWKSNPFRQNN